MAAVLAGSRVVDAARTAEDELTELPTLGDTLRQTSPPATVNGDRTMVDGNTTAGQRRPERMHSGRAKPGSRSQSRHQHHQQELNTVGEYALHHLFNSFIAQADQKINQCVADLRDTEPRIELICGPGVDPSFDQLISALGHIARQKPKPLIDTLMFWRKAKSEAANQARVELSQSRTTTPPMNGLLPRRNTENNAHTLHDDQAASSNLSSPFSTALAREQAVIQADRRSTVSIYLLCRVLIEAIGQSSLAAITPENAERLEDIIYTQLKAADPESLDLSPMRRANWVIFGQLLGVMSEINFESVCNRFITDLEIMQKHLAVKGAVSREFEGRAVLIIRGMRYLRIKLYPEDAWDRSCDFMHSLAKLAVNAHGHLVKYEYCQLFKELLLPIAAKATSELNIPKWKGFSEVLRQKLSQMLIKPKHWQNAFPVMAVLLCASPVDTFTLQWHQMILPLQPKLKDRATRAIAFRAICRLVWVYLYRNSSDTQNVTAKKLDDVVRLVFQPGKRSYLSTEPAIAEPLIQLIRIIGFKHQDLCFRSIIFPLMNAESFMSGKNLRVEDLEPERMVIGIRAFLAIMADLEKGEQPPFPVSFETDPFLEPSDIASLALSPRPVIQNTPKTPR